MDMQLSKGSKVNDQEGKKIQQSTRRRGVRRFLHVLYLFMWVLGSCSLPEVPNDGGTETPPIETATATALPMTPTAEEPLPTTTPVLPSPTITFTPEIDSQPTPTQANIIPPDGVETVENPQYEVQAGTPLGMANIARVEQGCNWLGIGGQVLDLDGMPVFNLVVEVGGILGEIQLLELALTGSETVFGPGGFVIQVADRPIGSDGTVWMQLFDLAGVAQTRKIYLTTYSDCERNLILVNFSALFVSTDTTIYLPAVNKEP